MDSGFGLFVIYILVLWLLTFTAFGLSFVKHKAVSTVSFLVFAAISVYFGYAVSNETGFSMPVSMAGMERIILAAAPVMCCILSVTSVVLWFCNKRKTARYLGLVGILAVICIYIGR